MLQVWKDNDFAYISHYLGDELAESIWMGEEEDRIRQEKARLEAMVREALDFQQVELIRKLRLAQRKFMIGLENEAEELEHLLSISRAFIYSYFQRVPEQTYCVPEELLL